VAQDQQSATPGSGNDREDLAVSEVRVVAALSRDSHRLPGMDLKDATLMILIESAAHPSVARIAQAAYDQLVSGQEVDYRVLDELVGEASGKGVLRAISHKYGATAHEAIFAPILREIDREKPVPPGRRPAGYQESADPLTASSW
jgi:hypothetical protein